MAEFDDAKEMLANGANVHDLHTWESWCEAKASAPSAAWLYLYRFSSTIFAWGTTSKGSDRLRKACLFNPRLTGKYDRRVDYLMLKRLHGMPKTWAFEYSTAKAATDAEATLRKCFGQSHCYRGLPGDDRMTISRGLTTAFKETAHFRGLDASDRAAFERYLEEVYFAKLKHPTRKASFHFGDSLEPKFLRVIGKADLEPAIERALAVSFPA